MFLFFSGIFLGVVAGIAIAALLRAAAREEPRS